MVLLWFGVGALVGALSAPIDGGLVGFAAGALAGMIVLPALGAFFALVGGRWQESLLGAACGLGSAIAYAIFSGYSPLAVSLLLLLGACAGATLPQMCRLYVWIAHRARAHLSSLRTERMGTGAISAVSDDGAINP
jgi:hypothetical protein